MYSIELSIRFIIAINRERLFLYRSVKLPEVLI